MKLEDMNEESKAVYKWNGLRSKCNSSQLPFNLTVQQIKKLRRIRKCQVTGEDIMSGDSVNQGDNTLTFDKIIPNKGYTYDNIAIVSRRINQLKGNMSLIDILQLSKFVKKYLGMSDKSESYIIKRLQSEKA